MVMTASHAPATAAGESAHRAPSCRSACAFAAVRFQTVTSCPCDSSLRAIALPMCCLAPRPAARARSPPPLGGGAKNKFVVSPPLGGGGKKKKKKKKKKK